MDHPTSAMLIHQTMHYWLFQMMNIPSLCVLTHPPTPTPRVRKSVPGGGYATRNAGSCSNGTIAEAAGNGRAPCTNHTSINRHASLLGFHRTWTQSVTLNHTPNSKPYSYP